MHKAVILLVKAGNKEQAIQAAKEFLDDYKDSVWDWYAIGGRWTGVLCPFYSEFVKQASEILECNHIHGFIPQDEVDRKQPILINIWEKLGGRGPNPYSDHYKLPDDGGEYDVVPLSSCIDKVKERQQTIEHAHTVKKKADLWLAKGGNKNKVGEPYDDWAMYGYSLKNASDLYQQDFCFSCNVFNTKKYDYSIPEAEDIPNWFAVMVDMHN